MTAIGVVFRPQNEPERLHAAVRAAEEAGLEQLWLWEDCFLESGVATAAAALAWSTRLHVGIGLLPVPLRNAALTAMEAATLHRLFPGRLTLGVGHGIQDWMAQVGARADSPLGLLGEHLEALGALLRGERVSTQGRYVRLDGVALDWPPRRPAPVFTGARGPRTLELSGRAADGTVLDAGAGPEQVRRARGIVDAARLQAGLPGRHHLVVYALAAAGQGARERLGAELRAEGLAGAGVGAAGGPEDLAREAARLAEAGADTVVFQPTADEPDLEGFIALVAHRVRPLVP